VRGGCESEKGFSLIELMVSIGIIALLMAILYPALFKARQQARVLLSKNNLRQVASGVTLYSADNFDLYPNSVATIGKNNNWNWQSPMVMTSIESHAPQLHRAMSEYLGGYISDASIMFCPSSPQEYTYLQEAWDAGDAWNNPDTWLLKDWVKGTYCFYWNYTGLLEKGLFNGPHSPDGTSGESNLLATCYFGYDLYRSEDSYDCCNRFSGASITDEERASSAYWSCESSESVNLNTIKVSPQACFTDGHVESYTATEAVRMKVIKDRFTLAPYTYGPGDYFLPQKSLR